MQRQVSPVALVCEKPSRTGAAAVEFAIVAPLFLTLLLGLVEMGRALTVTTSLAAAVRQGGRLATLSLTEDLTSGLTANEKVALDIRNMLSAAGLPGDRMEVRITYAEGAHEGSAFNLQEALNDLQLFRLSVEVPYSEVSFLPLSVMVGQKVTSSIVFRMGRSAITD